MDMDSSKPELGGETNQLNSSHESDEDVLPERETWSNKIQFLLGCIGFSVGLGNVWRFPYLCYRDGGGAFLLPYTLSVLLGAIPMFMLEIIMGQYTGQSIINCWNLVPLFKGVGYSIQLMIFLQNTYYNVIMGWSLFYLFASFTDPLPWSHCNNQWNTDLCRKAAHAYEGLSLANLSFSENGSSVTSLSSSSFSELSIRLGKNVTNTDLLMINRSVQAVDPVTEFWQNKVLGISEGVDKLGNIKWDLALCLLLAWIMVYFCIWKGIKWTGKIMYVTTTSPYIFMLILLVRGVTLPGSINGIKYYLYPDINKLTDLRVWYGAASQVFFSYSMCCGSLVALGSYNKFHHNFWKDSILFAVINSGTSLLAGFIIFSILGFMSYEHQVSVDQVAESGPGLAFIAYPKAVAELPGAPVWSVLFFIMLILLGMDSQFGCVEGFVVGMIDAFPRYLRRKHRREVFVGIVCAVSYLIGLVMCTNGGMYVFLLFDYYTQARVVVILAFIECTAIAWVYGAQRFHENMELMLGRKVWPLLKYCWMFLTPAFELVMIILCFYQYSHITYNRTYIFPMWSIGCGWAMAITGLSIIPIVAVIKLIQAEGTFMERIKFLISPDIGQRKDPHIDDIKQTPVPPSAIRLLNQEPVLNA